MTPSFVRGSYIELDLAMDTSNTLLQITFNPSSPNGYIFFAGNTSDAIDFLSLALVEGRLELDFDLGSGALPAPLRSALLEMNVWHTVFVSRDLRTATMIVNGIQYGPAMSLGGLTQLNVQGVVSLGGPRDFNILPENGRSLSNYEGCIASLVVSQNLEISHYLC